MVYRSSWKSPSNIAFVKYWGKKGPQIPMNASLSMTLSEAVTRTAVEFREGGFKKGIISINGEEDHGFLPKLRSLFDRISEAYPFLRDYALEITTENTFPHSAGIASSASGISAFTLCVMDFVFHMIKPSGSDTDFYSKASWFARLGSGSACRSVYGGYVLWGSTEAYPGGDQTFGVPVSHIVHPSMQRLHDCILVVSSNPKSISSSAGHALMPRHPYLEGRIRQAGHNLLQLFDAMRKGDMELFRETVENEALSLHALLATSPGGTLLMIPETLRIIEKVRNAWNEGIQACFTLDAGPNVHVIYPEQEHMRVSDFISSEILPVIQGIKVIYDQRGEGPQRLSNHISS